MTDRIVTAQITGSGPLQGAEVRIWWKADDFVPTFETHADVHLDAIGSHPARWVPLQDVDQYLADLDDADEKPSVVDLMAALEESVAAAKEARRRRLDADPLAEVAASHADRAAARTERRAHDAG